MPEITIAPALASNTDTKVGDATYVSGLAIDSTGTENGFGRDDQKTAENHGTVAQYSTASIPIGATINKAKLEMRASESEGGTSDLSVDFDVLGLTSKLDAADTSYHDAQFIYYPDYGIFPTASLWSDGRTSGSDMSIPISLTADNGIGSVAQAWTCDVASEDLAINYFYLSRSGSIGTATVTCKVYEANGSAGAYTKGTLVDAGIAKAASGISFGSLAAFYTNVASAFEPTYGATYISELTVVAGTGTGTINVGILSTAANGGSQNATIYAASGKSLQGFADGTQWLTGSRIKSATKVGTTDTVAGSSMPSFFDGNVYTFGDSAYSTTDFVALSNLTSNISTAIGARTSTSQQLGVRIQDFTNTTTDDRDRHFESSRSTIATSGSLYGLLLTIDYSLPSSLTGRVGSSLETISARAASADRLGGLANADGRLSAQIKVRNET